MGVDSVSWNRVFGSLQQKRRKMRERRVEE
jgi:hypothetical protein